MTHQKLRLEALRRQLEEAQQQVSALQDELAAEKRQRKLLQEISRSLELEQLLYIFSGEVSRLGAFDGYLINFVNPQRDGLVCARIELPPSHQGLAHAYVNFRFPLAERDANSQAFLNREVVYLDQDNLDAHEGLTKHAFQRWQAASMVIIPIPYGDRAIGTVIGFRQSGGIDRAKVEDFQARVLLFNEHIRNALLFHELKQHEQQVQSALEEHRKFLEFVSQVNKLTRPELIYEAITQEFVRAFRFDIAVMALAEDGHLCLKHASPRLPEHEPICERLRQEAAAPLPLRREEGAAAIALLQNIHIHIPDAAPIRHLPMSARDRQALEIMPSCRTVLHMPIREREQPIGVLGLYSLDEIRQLEGNELKIIELLSSFVGTAVSNAHMYSVIGDQKGQIEALNKELQHKIQQLDEMVRRDQLTGLHNFGAFKSELTRRTAEAERRSDHDGLSLVVFDVDHFKRFNDTYGHLAGNIVLQEVASRIERTARTMDIPCRFGGEEFVVILPKCDLEGARVVADRIRRAIGETPFHVEDKLLPVTVSAGCATFRKGETMDQFLERADAALYRAKQNGRNRVEVDGDAAQVAEGGSKG